MEQFKLSRNEIVLPKKNFPNLIMVYGSCRSGTTALSNVFVRAGIKSHMQPIKSARRAIEQKEKLVKLIIKEREKLILIKETLGPGITSELFNPIKILIDLGYPKEKIFGISIVRDPRQIHASWKRLWGLVEEKEFVSTQIFTDKIKSFCINNGINHMCFVHEAIRDNTPKKVVSKIFSILNLKNSKDSLTNWLNAPEFGSNIPGNEHLLFYDSPPDKFISGVKRRGGYKYKHRPFTCEDDLAMRKNPELENIYELHRRSCEKSLKLKIKKIEQ